MIFRIVRLLALVIVCLSVSQPARAEEPRRGAAFDLELDLDLPIVLIAGGMASGFAFLDEAPGVSCAPSCDRSRINRFDRFAAGYYDRSWRTVGDIATVSTLVAPPLIVLLDEGLAAGLNDDLVLLEAALVTSALQVTTSYAVSRPRPRVYGEEAPSSERSNANAARSFFSGHVANTVGVSVAALRTFQRLGRPALGWSVLGAGLAGSTLVGVSRVASGAHFPSDVLVGAAVGVGVGLALPAVHHSGARVVPIASADYAGLLLRGSL
jgi:membrane-associated phospholipid phosphatase